MTKRPPQFYRDARWIATFPEGSEWHTGAFRPNRERELVEDGVLVPTDVPGVFKVGRAPKAEQTTERARS